MYDITIWFNRIADIVVFSFFPLSLPLKSRTYRIIQNASGFFPVNHDNLKIFYQEYRADVKEMDLLVSWRIEEFFFREKVDYSDWFCALDYMKKEINKKDFDIALIGFGAYGLPLAAHVKRMGRKSVHMGGILQFLFGIKGKRYVEESHKTSKYINGYIVSPPDTDKPKKSNLVEGGCYW